MPSCSIKNLSDLPLCVTNPDTRETLCVMPGYTCAVNTTWPDVRKALQEGRVQVCSVGAKSGKGPTKL